MVLIRHKQGEWHQPETSAYSSEKALQELVKHSPSLLPPGTPMAVVDEFTISGIGSVDLVGISSSGDITIVECKLRANPEIRREVVGQVLAYAGGLWRMSYESFSDSFSRRAHKPLFESVEALEDAPADEAEFRDAIRNRLETGEFRLIIAVDDITPELKTIVEYLNEHTLPTVQVLALELAYGSEGEMEFLIPTVYGEESAKRKTRGTISTHWSEETFAEQVSSRTDGPVKEFVEKLLEHGSQRGDHPFYGSGVTPGMSYYYDLGGQPRSVWALYLESPTPKVALNFGTISKWSEEAALNMLGDLKSNSLLQGRLASVDASDLNKYPTFPVSQVLVDADAQSAFFKSLDDLLAETQSGNEA